ncbi:Methanol O-anthraniloyltransferase [Camellia lanceoleosa]|uniref:Methanol O-anthraniloyltransferase n=1 Tax=Camellia lanceoleosa TaxID=1840588 RepID=A0ACC0FIK7_9ERIC|nr:Methanol O-anthraniloyltransferase [Camellia lanceoleosa]
MEGKDPTSVIREALAKALVFYYSFAGRLVEGPNRKLLVDCTAEGVLFIETDANVDIDWLGDTVGPGCPYLEELMHDVPGSDGIVGCPLLLIQVYPKSWTAIYVALDNVGMWNLRSEFWARQYLGQQLYVRVYNASTSLRDEFPILKNALLCGRANGRHTRPL